MFSLRQKIEDAVIAEVTGKLAKECNPQSGYLAFVGPYNGELDQSEGPDDFRRRIRGRFPCVLVTAASATIRPESVERTRFTRILSVELYVGSDHLRDRESRLRMDVSAQDDPNCDPGIYRIVEDLHNCIAGSDFGLECVDYFEPSTEQVLLQEDGFTLWRLQFTVKTDAHVPPRDAGAGKYTSYAIDSNLENTDADPGVATFNPAAEASGDL